MLIHHLLTGMILQVVNVVYHVYPADVTAPGAVSLLAKDISHNDAPLKRQVGLEHGPKWVPHGWLDSDGLRDSTVEAVDLYILYYIWKQLLCIDNYTYIYICYILYLYVNDKGA